MHDRDGARQPKRFDPARAARLDDPARFADLRPEDVLALLDAPQGATVVDFGTGTGAYALEVARLRPDLRIVAFDEQPEMLDYLRAKPAATDRRLVIAGIEEIGAWNGAADRILAINVFHELGDAALGALAAMLARDGRALVIDWNPEVDRPHGPGTDHLYAPQEARDRLFTFGLITDRDALFRYQYAIRCARS